jgi:DNA topoisomerase-3
MRKILADTEGLGTDATRADIIERAIEKYHYLERDGSFIQSTWRGKALIAGLPPNLTSPAPTAMLELILDHIAAGTIQREDYLLDYVGELTDALEKTKKIIFRATPPKNTDSGHPSKPRHDRGRAHRASTKFTILGP